MIYRPGARVSRQDSHMVEDGDQVNVTGRVNQVILHKCGLRTHVAMEPDTRKHKHAGASDFASRSNTNSCWQHPYFEYNVLHIGRCMSRDTPKHNRRPLLRAGRMCV
jgi:hypothetical protein